MRNRIDFENDPLILNAIQRNLIEIHGDRITYNIHQKKTYNWADPEEWVRARTIEVCFPPDKEIQRSLIADVLEAKEKQKHATDSIGIAMLRFSDIIDGRGDEEFEAVFDDGVEEE